MEGLSYPSAFESSSFAPLASDQVYVPVEARRQYSEMALCGVGVGSHTRICGRS